jgi:hypothetical protein
MGGSSSNDLCASPIIAHINRRTFSHCPPLPPPLPMQATIASTPVTAAVLGALGLAQTWKQRVSDARAALATLADMRKDAAVPGEHTFEPMCAVVQLCM